jgi:hypothetical protein
VWSATPDVRRPLVCDLAAEAAAVTESVDVVRTHHGPATVTTATVGFDGMDPVRLYVLADIDSGRRCVASSADPSLIEAALAGELIGTGVVIAGTALQP